MAITNHILSHPKFFVTLAIFLLLGYTESVPKREILNSKQISPEENVNKHESKSEPQLPPTGSLENQAELMFRNLLIDVLGTSDKRQLDILTSLMSMFTSFINSIMSGITGLGGTASNSSSTLNLTSLIPSLPSLGSLTGSSGSSSLLGGIGGGSGGCDLLDPLLIANLPGIFILTPIVLGALAILIKIIVVIAAIIPKFTGPIVQKIFAKIQASKQQDQQSGNGWSQSIGNQYGAPSSSYGSPANSRLEGSIEAVTQRFAQAYDKYSNLQQNEYQQYEGANSNQYNQWNPQSQS